MVFPFLNCTFSPWDRHIPYHHEVCSKISNILLFASSPLSSFPVPKRENYTLITGSQRRCGKVLFSVMSVCSQGWGSHVTITHDALDFTVQEPAAGDMCGHHWRPVKTCSLQDLPPPRWHLVGIESHTVSEGGLFLSECFLVNLCFALAKRTCWRVFQ